MRITDITIVACLHLHAGAVSCAFQSFARTCYDTFNHEPATDRVLHGCAGSWAYFGIYHNQLHVLHESLNISLLDETNKRRDLCHLTVVCN
jgi:hypothetical protein